MWSSVPQTYWVRICVFPGTVQTSLTPWSRWSCRRPGKNLRHHVVQTTHPLGGHLRPHGLRLPRGPQLLQQVGDQSQPPHFQASFPSYIQQPSVLASAFPLNISLSSIPEASEERRDGGCSSSLRRQEAGGVRGGRDPHWPFSKPPKPFQRCCHSLSC